MSLRALSTSLVCLCLAAAAPPEGLHARGSAAAAPPSGRDREASWRENNVGVALMEQFRFTDAAEAFGRALAKDPSLLPARINLAIAYLYVPDVPAAKKAAEAALEAAPDAPQPNYVLALIARSEGRAEEALPYLRKVLDRDPKDLGANVTLGQVYLQLRDYEKAAAAFRVAVAAEPYNVSAAYNLGVALTRAGRREEGLEAMSRFQKLRDSAYKSALGSTYLEQGRYAEAVASTGAEEDAVDARVPDVSFVEKDRAVAEGGSSGRPAMAPGPSLGRRTRPGEAPRELPRAALVLADLDGDGSLDAVEAGTSGLRVLRNEKGRLHDVTEASGLAHVSALAAVAGDYDNDGHPDLLVLGPAGLSLFHNDGQGRFGEVTSSAQVPAYPFLAASAAFVDIDHDGDLDVFVAGLADVSATPKDADLDFPGAFAPAPSLLLQNNGNGTFSDVTAAAGLEGPGHALAVVPTDFDNRRDVDLLVLRREGPALLKNMRDGSFRDVAADVGLDAARGSFLCAAAADVDKDGYVDFFLGAEGRSFLAMSDGRGGFRVESAPAATEGAEAAQFTDYDNDGLLDLLVATGRGPRLLRNLGAAWSDVSNAAFGGPLANAALEGAALGVADLDADGDQDVVLATPVRLRYLANEGGNRNRSFAVDLVGRVSNKGGVGAKVEVRAGSLRQKIETSDAVPMAAPADVVFGLGRRAAPDAVRVIWVSGIVQTETGAPAAPEEGRRASLGVMELDRKPSSCPYLYAWNGERFDFVTDFLGGGEMGYWEGPGVWNRPDPVEYVRISPDRLRPKDGRYELRVTNELEEVLYLDRLRLLAVDHPADVEVYPDEGMVEPPKAYRLFAARDPLTPRAYDHRGRDVTERLRRLDRVYVDQLPLERVRGYAGEHSLVLDLSGLPPTHTLLLLTGWTDYAFSSDNVAARQAGLRMEPPALQVEGADGSWETVEPDIGIPVGRPQTVVVDLEGRWRSRSRRVRIVTTMRIYWDEARVAAPDRGLDLDAVPLDPVRADLTERGFSAESSPDGREPWSYDYARALALSPWKTMPGRYTRLGDVRALLAATDDAFVVSKPGDEVALSFDAASLPPVRPGWTRTFLLHGDGFSKEMDINSASPDVVQPLPYHGMRSYPYADGDLPPATRRTFERAGAWNTRVVVRPIVPLDLFAFGVAP